MEIPEVTDAARAFGDITHLPKWKDIPEEFQKGKTKWNELFNHWFYRGAKDINFTMKDNRPTEDFKKVVRVLQAIMSSFEPKHEHKEAGVAYLMSQWFEDWSVDKENPVSSSHGGS